MIVNQIVETAEANQEVIISYPASINPPPVSQMTGADKKTTFEDVKSGGQIEPVEDTTIRVVTTTIEEV